MMKMVYLLIILFTLLTTNVYGFSECEKNIKKMFSDDIGNLYLFYDEGGSTRVPWNSAGLESAVAVALTAMMGNKTTKVRYEDGTDCLSVFQDNTFKGILIYK